MEIRLGPTFDIRAPGPSVGAISIIQFGGGHPNRSIGNQLYMSGRYRRGHTIPRPLAGGRTGRRPLAAGLNVYRLRSFVTPASGTEVSAHSSSRVERRLTTCRAWQKRPMPRLRPVLELGLFRDRSQHLLQGAWRWRADEALAERRSRRE